MGKVKRTYSIEATTVAAIERMALQTRRDRSTIVEMAIELLEDHLIGVNVIKRPDSGRLEEAETIDLVAAAE